MRTKAIFVSAIIILNLIIASASAGTIAAWGYNAQGQSNAPTGDDFIDIAGGGYFSLALKSDGSLTAWGQNEYGQCVVPTGNNFVDVTGGIAHGFALKSDGSLVAWGKNFDGQCDVSTEMAFSSIAAGGHHSLAIKFDGSLAAWGQNSYGQCDVPVGDDFVDISGGYLHSLALKTDGSLAAWGRNNVGQCDTPVGYDFVAIASGGDHNLALKADGSLAAWGQNGYGQCDIPVGYDFVAIAAGSNHNLALKSNGSLVTWGYNVYGQCDVPTGNNFVGIATGDYHSLAIVGEPTQPPTANAKGPYTVFVGDPLTLDGSGSTDPDNDIVSYMWDLDDDEVYETDAGTEAILTVDYTYLESLPLLVSYEYTIHLKVTDSKGQSDTADSTLVILPKPALKVAVDIKPDGCPNPLNTKSSGVLPVAILGSADFDVTTIDISSIFLSGVQPIRSSLEDVGTPLADANDCDCTELGPDGILDLTLKFDTREIVDTLDEVDHGDILELQLSGILYDPAPYERPIEGADCVVIKGKHKPLNKGDINRDGNVNMADILLIAENWLQSSIGGFNSQVQLSQILFRYPVNFFHS